MMKTWEADYTNRHYQDKGKVTVAAPNFSEAVKKVRKVARRRMTFQPHITSIVMIAKLDA
jgi:hypothetical protein